MRTIKVFTKDIILGFSEEMGRLDHATAGYSKSLLGEYLIDLDKTIFALENIFLYLNTYLLRIEQIDFEEEQRRMEEEAKRKRKKGGKEPEQAVESQENQAGTADKEEKKEEQPADGNEKKVIGKPGRIALLFDQAYKRLVVVLEYAGRARRSGQNFAITQINTFRALASALARKDKDTFSEKITRAKLDMLVGALKAEQIEMVMYTLMKAKQSYLEIYNKFSDVLLEKEPIDVPDSKTLIPLSFIQAYTRIEKLSIKPEQLFIRHLGPSGLDETLSRTDALLSELYSSIYGLYLSMLDGELLSLLNNFMAQSILMRRQAERIKGRFASRDNLIQEKAVKALRTINRMVSEEHPVI